MSGTAKATFNPYTRGGLRAAGRKLLKNKLATLCFIQLLALVVVQALAPLITPWGPEDAAAVSYTHETLPTKA